MHLIALFIDICVLHFHPIFILVKCTLWPLSLIPALSIIYSIHRHKQVKVNFANFAPFLPSFPRRFRTFLYSYFDDHALASIKPSNYQWFSSLASLYQTRVNPHCIIYTRNNKTNLGMVPVIGNIKFRISDNLIWLAFLKIILIFHLLNAKIFVL